MPHSKEVVESIVTLSEITFHKGFTRGLLVGCLVDKKLGICEKETNYLTLKINDWL